MALREFLREDLLALFNGRIEAVSASEDAYIYELKEYLKASDNRIFLTLDLIKKYYHKGQGEILEFGSFPFFFSLSLLELSDDKVTGIVAPDNAWPGEPYSIDKNAVTIKANGKIYPFTYWTVNVEKDRLPFADESFDFILCAEVLEHLIHSPDKMVYEINRVLKNNGLLILTTPNGLFWQYIYKLIFWGSWEPYAKYGAYSRHNRLWALNEINDFLRGNNFNILESICGYARVKRFEIPKRDSVKLKDRIQDLFFFIFSLFFSLPIPFCRKKDGDQLYVVAKKAGPPKMYSPNYLYSINFSYNVEK